MKLTNTKETSNRQTDRERERERQTDRERGRVGGGEERIMDTNAGCKRVEFRLRTTCQAGNNFFWENEKKGLLIVPQFIW